MDWRIWWKGTRKYTFLGGIAGLGLCLALTLIFMNPVEVGYITGALIAGVILVLAFMLARYSYRTQPTRGAGYGMMSLLIGGALAVILGIQVAGWVKVWLTPIQPQPGWLLLDCSLAGIIGGTAYGNFKTLAKRKSLALASATSLLLVLIPSSLFVILSYYGLPLPL